MKHQDLVIADLLLTVDLGQLSVRHISISLLRHGSELTRFVELLEILTKVDALLEELVAAPGHGHEVEVLKEGDEPDEVGVLQKLLHHVVHRQLDVLEVVPLEQPLLLLSQRLLLTDAGRRGSGTPARVKTVRACRGTPHAWLPESKASRGHGLVELAQAVATLFRHDHGVHTFIEALDLF